MTASQGFSPLELKSESSFQRLVAKPSDSSLQVELPFGVWTRTSIAVLVERSPSAVSTTLGSSWFRRGHPTETKYPSAPRLALLFRVWPDPTAVLRRPLFPGSVPSSDISSGGPVLSGLPHPTPSAFRVSHPPDGFLPPEPSGLVSCRCHSWGFPLRAFPSCRAFSLSQAWLPSWRYRSPGPRSQAHGPPSGLSSLQETVTCDTSVSRCCRPLPSRVSAF